MKSSKLKIQRIINLALIWLLGVISGFLLSAYLSLQASRYLMMDIRFDLERFHEKQADDAISIGNYSDAINHYLVALEYQKNTTLFQEIGHRWSFFYPITGAVFSKLYFIGETGLASGASATEGAIRAKIVWPLEQSGKLLEAENQYKIAATQLKLKSVSDAKTFSKSFFMDKAR